MSSEKTTNYGLHKWARDDLFLMEEFNENNTMVDEALEACALVRLKTVTLSADANQVSIDLSDLPLSKLGELHLRINGCHNGTGLRGVQMTFNKVKDAESYLWTDLAQDSEMTADTAMVVGKLTGENSGHCGLKVEVELYDQGISCHSLTMAGYTDSSTEAGCYLGILSMSNTLTRDNLNSIQIRMESSSIKFKAGTVITVYGVRM